ncbi:glycosyltransferase family 4 protein [Donghicola mangrovi]|uniref:Glycosyltransferase family 4 protein n=1 Tax=Donghicola mangrovi TaxID=2729614 RepID=A0A850Q8H2_9RHOB|nr:glycosyltransferase family 1 protein [Donghicola mangrovi]NVO25214.1 glycosyltransferase family 4 protein [Donghicola mangrovi]
MSRYLFNTRFLMRPLTGVDRVATELISATLAQCNHSRLKDISAIRPTGEIHNAHERPKNLLELTSASKSRLKGHLWEQISLAKEDPNSWLISLCNIGPALRKKQIVMMHDAQAFRQPLAYSRGFRTFYHQIQPRLGNRAHSVLTVSAHSKRELEHFGVVPKGKAIVIQNGADHVLRLIADPKILQKNNLEASGYFLAIGSLAPHKNLKMLIQAANARSDQSRPLVIAGGGNATVFSENGLVPSENVKMLGRVTDEELRALYENAYALVFPSITEGFGLPPAEAMTLGCPVIASDGGAIPEVAEGASISISPLDQAAWTQAMDSLSRNDSLRTELAESGKVRAKRFTWNRAASQFLEILDALP